MSKVRRSSAGRYTRYVTAAERRRLELEKVVVFDDLCEFNELVGHPGTSFTLTLFVLCCMFPIISFGDLVAFVKCVRNAVSYLCVFLRINLLHCIPARLI